ncbi:hypothetical protein M970_021500 [Encephalitozoon cuniculi EcunIII-L]|nr:hypothetical protein M970_021500 [Encephalitozoon cuniculi EcunIII-L]
MEELEDGFVPDFVHLATAGEVANRNSLVKRVGNAMYISVGSQINAWNIRFSEIEKSIFTLKKRITHFDFSDGILVVGYENGVVQIHSNEIISFRPHSRRVTKVAKIGDCILSSSADGSIILYDLVGEEIRISYEGNDICVEKFFSNSKVVVAVCTDNTLRVWDLEDRHIKSVHMFEKALKDVFVIDEEAVIFFRDGESTFYNLEDKTSRPFNKFKKLRNIKIKEEKIFIQSKNKLHIYGVDKRDRIILKHLETMKISDRYVDFDVTPDGGVLFAAVDNCWECVENGKIYSFGFHRNEILGFEVCEEKIITFSKESIIIWLVDGKEIRKIGSIRIKHGRCMCTWSGNIVVGRDAGFSCYSILNCELTREEIIGPVSSISSNADELLVGKDNVILFYDNTYMVSRILEIENQISSIEASGALLCVGLLNSKVHIYSMDDLSLKITLYGHALPVRSMQLSPDSSELLTCGADKTVKMWGTQFGECRKSFIGDSKCVEYLNKDLFMFASGRVQYFKRYEKLKEFRHYDSSLVKVRKDMMISCGRFNIDLYSMDKYELQKEGKDESDEEEVIQTVSVVNYKVYDRFLTRLEELSNSFSNENVKLFFDVLMDIDFCELDKFLCLMNSSDVIQVMNVLYECINWNVILVGRVFISLVRLHRDICICHPRFKIFLKGIIDKTEEIREQASGNEGKLLVKKSICMQETPDFE